MQNPCVQGFRKASALTSEKKEAVPLPLFALRQLELVVFDAAYPLGFRLLAGFFLCCAWGSLRFSDGERTGPFTLCMDGYVLRGKSWRTKVCDRGVLSGVLGCGLTSSHPSWGWAHHWVAALREWLGGVAAPARRSIDFLLPHLAADGRPSGTAPISYSTAVLRLRSLLGSLNVKHKTHTCLRHIRQKPPFWHGQHSWGWTPPSEHVKAIIKQSERSPYMAATTSLQPYNCKKRWPALSGPGGDP